MEIKGVDLSYCQEGINYNTLKSNGIKFAILRAGFSEKKDVTLDGHIKGCKTAGINIGYYWYSYATTVDEARREAKACINVIKNYDRPTYPVFFDAEEDKIAKNNSKKVTTDMALAFCEEIEKAGYPAGVYANPNWINNNYDKTRLVGKVDIWLAHWTKNPNTKSSYNFGQNMWQWGTTYFNGMETDANLCFIDYPAKTAKFYSSIGKTNTTTVTSNKNSSTTTKKSIDEVAKEVIRGDWGNGNDRVKKLTAAGYNYTEVQNKVNEILYGNTPKLKSIDEVAKEVIRGDWGNGNDRVKKLTAAGYNYNAVQKRVNELL